MALHESPLSTVTGRFAEVGAAAGLEASAATDAAAEGGVGVPMLAAAVASEVARGRGNKPQRVAVIRVPLICIHIQTHVRAAHLQSGSCDSNSLMRGSSMRVVQFASCSTESRDGIRSSIPIAAHVA